MACSGLLLHWPNTAAHTFAYLPRACDPLASSLQRGLLFTQSTSTARTLHPRFPGQPQRQVLALHRRATDPPPASPRPWNAGNPRASILPCQASQSPKGAGCARTQASTYLPAKTEPPCLLPRHSTVGCINGYTVVFTSCPGLCCLSWSTTHRAHACTHTLAGRKARPLALLAAPPSW